MDDPEQSKESDRNIISNLKTILLKLLLFIQEQFQLFWDLEPVSESSLRVELYNGRSDKEIFASIQEEKQKRRYSLLHREMKEQFKNFEKGEKYLEGDFFFERWGKAIVSNAKAKGYIGLEQFNFVMAEDCHYPTEVLIPIFENT